MMSLQQIHSVNTIKLKNNEYPGRGIVIGMTENSECLVQIYWIMGRSENSRNRIFERDNDFVRTKAFDESKITDPSLIIYFPIKHHLYSHIVSNGDQTDTIFDHIQKSDSFETALMSRKFEPDAPHFTPRISGLVFNGPHKFYALSILKSGFDASVCQRSFFYYDNFIAGSGHCLHTYLGNGNPIPSFCGEPYMVPIFNNISDNTDFYWDLLNKDNRISLLTKYINLYNNKFQISIINKHFK